jgi:CRP-like cAMP-binding protein
MPDDRMDIFGRFEILNDLPAAALDDLARSCAWMTAPAGKQILLVNEPSAEVYFIASGKVRVLLYSAAEGKPVLFATLGPLDMFGELAAIDGKARSATVEAEEDCELAVLSKGDFQRLAEAHPALALQLHSAARSELCS